MNAPQAYPLAWPSFRPRTPPHDRKPGSFSHSGKKIKIPEASERLEIEIERLGGEHITISSNIRPTLSGRPAANAGIPDDPGVAVYFMLDGDPIVLACDTFDSVAQNLAGLAGHIEATRRIDRYGVQKAKETLQAFAALPSPDHFDWREVLGLKGPVTVDDVKRKYRELSLTNHPDQGGSPDQQQRINRACDEAIKELS